jgi:hypothetical protein
MSTPTIATSSTAGSGARAQAGFMELMRTCTACCQPC